MKINGTECPLISIERGTVEDSRGRTHLWTLTAACDPWTITISSNGYWAKGAAYCEPISVTIGEGKVRPGRYANGFVRYENGFEQDISDDFGRAVQAISVSKTPPQVIREFHRDQIAKEANDSTEKEIRDLKCKAEMTDEDKQQAALVMLEHMGDPEIIRTFQEYIKGSTMREVAITLETSKSTIRRRLKQAEEKIGGTIIRKPGGAAHAGDTYRMDKRIRNNNHKRS